MRITARLIIRYNSARGRNWRRRAHRANVTNRHQTKTVEKFGKDSPTVFIYRFSGIPASSYPRCSIKRSSENVSKSIECSNARSMDTRQSLKAFYASIRYSVPVVHSSLQHCKLYVFIKLTVQNYGFSWGPAKFKVEISFPHSSLQLKETMHEERLCSKHICIFIFPKSQFFSVKKLRILFLFHIFAYNLYEIATTVP